MNPKEFVNTLANIRLPNVFNPYAERCTECDRPDAAKLRSTNLEIFLQGAINARVETMWIARDLGYRGGRRTGIALTDEIHLSAVAGLFGGLNLARATRGPVVAERTAAVVWKVITLIGSPIFLWNVFPLHPYEPDDPFSNRCHTRLERLACRNLLFSLLDMIRPKQVIAIGRDAQAGRMDYGISCDVVRHPSYGGQTDFMNGLFSLYGLQSNKQKAKQPALF